MINLTLDSEESQWINFEKFKTNLFSVEIFQHEASDPEIQKQPPEVFCSKRNHKKTPVPESLF